MTRAMTDHLLRAAQFLGLWLLIAVVLALGTPELARRPPEDRAALSGLKVAFFSTAGDTAAGGR